jgi:TolA-binding protein
MGNYNSAVENYQVVMADYPTSNYVFDAVNGIQYSYVAQGDHIKAVSFIDQFISRNPGLSFSDQIFFKKGEIFYSARNYDAAKVSYQEFIANYPKSKLVPEAYYWIGKSAQNLNQNEEAIHNFNRVFESHPNSESASAAIVEMGNIYNSEKNYDAAIEIYNRALDKLSQSPRIAEILFMKGSTLINKQDYAQAYDVFDEVIQYYNRSIFGDKAKFELGLLELATENYSNADLYFTNLAETRSDDLGAQAQYYLGVSLAEQEKYEEAISALERVRLTFAGYDEWLTKSYLMLGEVYTKQEQIEKAKEMYRAVLSRHRGNAFGQEAQNKLRELQ